MSTVIVLILCVASLISAVISPCIQSLRITQTAKKKREFFFFFLIMRFLVFVLIFATFVTSIFCEQHFKGEIVSSQQFSPDLV